MPAGSPAALSVYDAAPLKATLEELVDFDLIEDGPVRLSVGAVNIRSGNFAYFDSADQRLHPEHIMASGALPPGLPPVIIEGEAYWDGGLVSNTPLQYILDYTGEQARQVHLPGRSVQRARGHAAEPVRRGPAREGDPLLQPHPAQHRQLPGDAERAPARSTACWPSCRAELRDDPDAELLRNLSCNEAVTIVHLIHRRAAYETHAQDYEFSRLSIEEHWQAGRNDVTHTLRHPKWRKREKPDKGVRVLDLAGG